LVELAHPSLCAVFDGALRLCADQCPFAHLTLPAGMFLWCVLPLKDQYTAFRLLPLAGTSKLPEDSGIEWAGLRGKTASL
jgi:hypothetical protein